LKRLISVAAVVALAALSLAACSSGNSIVPNSHVTVGEIGSIQNLNTDIVGGSSSQISGDLAQLTTQSFYVVNKNGELVPDSNFGTVKVVKTNPFTVTYSLGKSAVWSDGTALDSADLALAVIAAQDKDFKSIRFGHSLSNAKITGSPKAGSKSLSLIFDQPIADWKTALSVAVPAHTVGKLAGIGSDASSAKAGVLSAIVNANVDALNQLAEAYRSAFSVTAQKANFVTDGAYTISSAATDQIVLVARQGYAGTHPAVAAKVNLKAYPDNASAIKDVSTGAVDLISPQASLNEPQSDLVGKLQALSAKTVTVVSPDSSLAEQFVINLGSGNLSDSSYNNPKTAQTLRAAFMNIVPKSRAIDFASLTQTVARADSFVYAPSSKNYPAVSSSNGSSSFELQDAEKSSELVSSLNLTFTVPVRVLFNSSNSSAVAEWTLLSDHASTSGLNLLNISSPDPSAALASGNYDVYLGPEQLLGVGSGSVQSLVSGPSRMPIDTYNRLTKAVLAAPENNLNSALSELDNKLFDYGYGLPMYQLPTLLAYNKRIQGLVADPFGTNATWGYWTWQVSTDK
jgi:peptide/nickel transport system substrate-binding protein